MTTENNLPFLADVDRLDQLQLAWLSGYCWAKAKGGASTAAAASLTALSATVARPLSVTVLSASQTGNAKSVADKLASQLTDAGISVNRVAAKDYKAKKIADEQLLLLVTSTQGEGEPPEEAVVLYKFLHGKKAPKLTALSFAVLGLGDTSYPNFCQAGKDFDKKLVELGATRLTERVDADLNFQPIADKWIAAVVALVKDKAASQQQSAVSSSQVFAPSSALATASQYNKHNPFPATLITNQKITARESEKDVRHLELDLSGSGLTYQTGDALGVWFDNDDALVAEILSQVGLQGDEIVTLNDKTLAISSALKSELDITQNTPLFIKAYAQLTDNTALAAIAANPAEAQQFVACTSIVDTLLAYPAKVEAQQFAELFRPLTPRLYSISSAQQEVGDEVHLSVGVLRYEHNGKARAGAASSYLAERVAEDENVRGVFVEPNEHFRLPQDHRKGIIMIGSGTGIAPFRAFVQQRAADEAEGKNWLIFGNQHFAYDFLYQTEWQQFAKDGFLHKYDFAWSRDQAEKIYVQDKIRQQATALWQWLQEGAYIYVCGDAARMAKDVEQALLEVIAEQGKLDADGAEEYLNELRENHRYQRDVY